MMQIVVDILIYFMKSYRTSATTNMHRGLNGHSLHEAQKATFGVSTKVKIKKTE